LRVLKVGVGGWGFWDGSNEVFLRKVMSLGVVQNIPQLVGVGGGEKLLLGANSKGMRRMLISCTPYGLIHRREVRVILKDFKKVTTERRGCNIGGEDEPTERKTDSNFKIPNGLVIFGSKKNPEKKG